MSHPFDEVIDLSSDLPSSITNESIFTPTTNSNIDSHITPSHVNAMPMPLSIPSSSVDSYANVPPPATRPVRGGNRIQSNHTSIASPSQLSHNVGSSSPFFMAGVGGIATDASGERKLEHVGMMEENVSSSDFDFHDPDEEIVQTVPLASIVSSGDEDEDDDVNVNADADGVGDAAGDGGESDGSYEVNDDPHCYCRLPWDGDEKMIECDSCRIWYHFDCMGIPSSRTFGEDEQFFCDECSTRLGMSNSVSDIIPRRDRRKELKKAKAKSDRKKRTREEKKLGLSASERKALRSKERLARRKEREAKNAERAKEIAKQKTTGGLKNLLAAFDEDSDESSQESDTSTSEDEESEDEKKGSNSSSTSQQQPSPTTPSPKPQKASPALVQPSPRSSTSTSAASNRVTTSMSKLIESTRSKVRSSLESVLNSSLSAMIEESLFQAHQQSTGKSYLAQYRDIMANLKDTKNDLKDRILSGRLLPSALATMSSKELASSEMAQERERIRQLAVKNSVRPVSPPRDKSLIRGTSLLSAADDTPIREDVLNDAITGSQVVREVTTPNRANATTTASGDKSKIGASLDEKSLSATSSASLLSSLPKLGSYEEVIKSYRESEQIRNGGGGGGGDSNSSDSTSGDGQRKNRRKQIASKNAAILAKANADLKKDEDEERSKNRLEVSHDSPSTSTTHTPSPRSAAPSSLSSSGTSDDTAPVDTLYQDLNLPPMDVWNGDLLLSAGANPNVLTSYFSLVAKQFGGPPILTLPIPSRIEESLRINIEEVEKYIELVVKRKTKRVVLVEFHLNLGTASGVAVETLKDDWRNFAYGYTKKDRALAFDYQKDRDITNRLLFYVIPPDTVRALSSDFVDRTLHVTRPAGRMWGIVILPKETYQPIAKRFSKMTVKKLQAEFEAIKRHEQEQAEAKAAAAAAAAATPAVSTPKKVAQRPTDPRRRLEQEKIEAQAKTTNEATTSTIPNAGDSVSPPSAAPTSSTSAADIDLAAVLKSNPESLEYFNQMLSRLVDKTTGTHAATSTSTAPHPPQQSTTPLVPPPMMTTQQFPPPPATTTQAQAMFPPPASVQAPSTFTTTTFQPPPPQAHMQPHLQPHHPSPPNAYPHQASMSTPPPAFHSSSQPAPMSVLGKHPRDAPPGPGILPGQPPTRKSRFGPDKSHAPIMPTAPMTHAAPPGALPSTLMPSSSKSGTCDFFFSQRGCVKDNCNYSHDPTTISAMQIMRNKGIPPHLKHLITPQMIQAALNKPTSHQPPAMNQPFNPSMSAPVPPPPSSNQGPMFQSHPSPGMHAPPHQQTHPHAPPFTSGPMTMPPPQHNAPPPPPFNQNAPIMGQHPQPPHMPHQQQQPLQQQQQAAHYSNPPYQPQQGHGFPPPHQHQPQPPPVSGWQSNQPPAPNNNFAPPPPPHQPHHPHQQSQLPMAQQPPHLMPPHQAHPPPPPQGMSIQSQPHMNQPSQPYQPQQAPPQGYNPHSFPSPPQHQPPQQHPMHPHPPHQQPQQFHPPNPMQPRYM